MDKTNLIVSTPDIHSGHPRIAGTRMPVVDVGMLMENGATVEWMIEQFDLTAEQVQAAVEYFEMHRDEMIRSLEESETRMRKLVETGVVKEWQIPLDED